MSETMHIDPVCGMEIESTQLSFELKDKSYYFCSQGCLTKFKNSPDEFTLKNSFDLVIIGGGPAGLTAAVYASLSRIEQHDGKFEVLTKGKDRIFAKSVIIATGMKKRKLGISGEDRLQRKGVSYSSVQDVGMYKGLDVVVIGGGNSGLQTADELMKVGCQVTIVTQGKMLADPENIEKLKKNVNIRILEGYDVTEIFGKDKVEGIVIQSEESLKTKKLLCKGVFIQVGFVPNTEFCRDFIELNSKGEIVINQDCLTNNGGVFACGDVTNISGKRIIIASGEGAKAILSAKKYLNTVTND